MGYHEPKLIIEYKDRGDVDMSNWDIDDDTGTLCHVVWTADTLQERFNLIHKIETEVELWAKENIHNECYYTFESLGVEIVFYFKSVEDAFLFKLTWG